MKSKTKRSSPDFVSAITLLCIFGFIITLSLVAASTPSARQILTAVMVGLGASGLILLREHRKTASNLATTEARAIYIATHDGVTSLPNKTLMLGRVKSAWDTNVQAAIICVGLDRFEEVSEALGHNASDEIVAEMASRLLSFTREHDTLCRLSEDVFALLWLGGNLETAEGLAGQIVKRAPLRPARFRPARPSSLARSASA